MNELTLMQKLYETRLRGQMERGRGHDTNEAEAEAEASCSEAVAEARYSGLEAEALTRT